MVKVLMMGEQGLHCNWEKDGKREGNKDLMSDAHNESKLECL